MMETDKIDKGRGFVNALVAFGGVCGFVALAVVTASITTYAIAAFMVLALVCADNGIFIHCPV